MIYFLAIKSSLLLVFIGVLHFYWAVGGKWAINNVSPTKGKGEKIKMPGFFITFLVGIVLVFIGFMYAIQGNILSLNINRKIPYYAVLIFASIFLLRVIGDFKYVGLFKKIKDTVFAKYDNMVFIPFCFLLAVIGFALVSL